MFKRILNRHMVAGIAPEEVAMCDGCYLRWRRRDEADADDDHRTYQVAVRQYLQKENREPPLPIQQQLARSGFADQWKACVDEWKRDKAEAERARRMKRRPAGSGEDIE